ncbi:RNA polymerase sigma factor [Variovorax sp. KK3]|uniref:RNA polymerase sigma factor n=1 Tax=Variovorax sp. KK3 TaxID=1855728 RepID=UPI0011805C47|nr:sigma factor-like helix-turn-helix DNA-binding protein [Variovorax sp. KK3]
MLAVIGQIEEQLTVVEAADRLGITREACKSRIHRGRALLREYLQGDGSRGYAA